MKIAIAFLIGWVALAVCIDAQSIHVAEPAQPTPTFEAVSIKRNVSGTLNGGIQTMPGGGLVMVNMPLRAVIGSAYPTPQSQFAGLPEWVLSDRYDITVKATPGATRDQRIMMWRAMFADRMKLVAHYETREVPAYALVTVSSDKRLGPKMKGPITDCISNAPRPVATPGKPLRQCGGTFAVGELTTDAMAMSQLALSLASTAGRPVVDQTGLEGLYEFKLTFSPGLPVESAAGTADGPPSIFAALEEQLGLKLLPVMAPMQVAVIDHIERPSEN